MEKETLIKVSNLHKSFRLPHEKHNSIKGILINFFRSNRTIENQRVLNDISFEVKRGEFFGIVGRNGSGKSTLLKILAGIYTPTQGKVEVRGKLTPFIELGVGFNQELTGRENVFLNGALLGFSRKEMTELYDEIVEFAELERFMDQKLKNYSSGMQVRLAFSIAIRARSDILLVDEVLAVGDAAFQQKCYDYFRELKKQGRTVVFISHDMGAVKQFCDRSIAIENGKIAEAGDNQEVTNYYRGLLLLPDSTKKNAPVSRGVGAITVSEVRVINKQGKVAKKIHSQDAFSIEFKYKNNRSIDRCIFGIGIMDRQGTNVIGPNTKQSIGLVDLKQGGRIRCEFSPTNLVKGNYEIIVSAFNETETVPYEFLENATSLSIEDNQAYGLVTPKTTWVIG